jgi:hypothetical protein
MSRCVIPTDGFAATSIDCCDNCLPRYDFTLKSTSVDNQTPSVGLSIFNVKFARLANNATSVTHLPTRFGVKRRAIQKDFNLPVVSVQNGYNASLQ